MDWHSVAVGIRNSMGIACVLCVSPTGHTKMLRCLDHSKKRYGVERRDWDPHQIEVYGSTVLGESYRLHGH